MSASAGMTVLLQSTGEVVRVVDAATLLAAAGITDTADASVKQLADFTLDATLLKQIASEAQLVASDELINRMDANASWTLRENGIEIKAASPDAGSVGYDLNMLRDTLHAFVDAGIITRAGLDSAIETVLPTAPVSYELLRQVFCALDGDLSMAAEQLVRDKVARLLLEEPEPVYRVRAIGVKALMKNPRCRVGIERCQVAVTPPRRVAKVRAVA